MDRRSKIIVSVVGIFIVLLALIGITYAYFLTRVEGNTNETSISITTANLRIVYDDNNSQINATNIQPGDTVYTKTFTVTNEGNETVDYEVYLENVINDFVHYNDLRMYITCVNQDNEACNGYGIDTDNDGDIDLEDTNIYPRVNSKLIENTINPASEGVEKEVHTYTLYLQFRDNGDQSDDMGKILQGKVQIYDPKDIVSISGMLTGYEEGYYVQLQSETKTSELKYEKTVDNVKYYSYVFHGVEPEEESHTLSIMKKGSTTPIVQKSITVTKGNEASVNTDASNIVIADSTLNIEMDIALTKSGETTTITTTAGEIEKIPYLKDVILTNNTPYADNVRSTYVNSDTGIDFSKPASTILTYKDVRATTTTSANIWSTYYGTSYTFDQNKGTYKLSGIKNEDFSKLSPSRYSPYYTCNMSSATSECEILYEIIAKENEYTAIVYQHAAFGASFEETNGKGLYYTSTNTEGNKPTYYFRGNVENNYISIGTQGGECISSLPYNMPLYHKDTGSIENPVLTEEQCLSTPICESLLIIGEHIGYTEEECVNVLEGTYHTDTYATFVPTPIFYRIVRINEDGSVRLIYQGDKNVAQSIAYELGIDDNSISFASINNFYSEYLRDYDDIIVDTGFCADNVVDYEYDSELSDATAYKFKSLNRLTTGTPQFKCLYSENGVTDVGGLLTTKNGLVYPIGYLTMDEALYAGGMSGYLIGHKNGRTITIFEYDQGFPLYQFSLISADGRWGSFNESPIWIYPVINIRGDLIVDGNGTIENPYTIKTN